MQARTEENAARNRAAKIRSSLQMMQILNWPPRFNQIRFQFDAIEMRPRTDLGSSRSQLAFFI
jgi:hypothetical protein